MRTSIGFIILAGALAAPELHAQTHDHPGHAAGAHATHAGGTVVLTEAGNGAFAALQEVVRILESRPDTDWEKVDLEALRQHLIDMEHMTLRAEVVSHEAVPGGARFRVRGTDDASHAAIGRALSAHARMIAHERGWTMEVVPGDGEYGVVVTSPREADVARIRGLGYIGIMALGDHHAPHHWMIATGDSPHVH